MLSNIIIVLYVYLKFSTGYNLLQGDYDRSQILYTQADEIQVKSCINVSQIQFKPISKSKNYVLVSYI